MKKTLAIAITISVIGMNAVSANSNTATYKPNSVMNVQQTISKILNAKKQRFMKYLKNKYIKKNEYSTRIGQKVRHNKSRAQKNTSDESTILKRDGELKFVPHYDKIREHVNSSYLRTNQKQVFRARAINYYLDGGKAGAEEISKNIIFGSKHKVPRVFNRTKKQQATDINKELRDIQRNIGQSEQVPAGHQKTVQRTGDMGRNYFSPYTKGLANPYQN